MYSSNLQDSGHGLDPASIDRIFDPYFSTRQMSSGLGLTISHSIIDQHGGEILARNTESRGPVF
jgi:signal transduction histidine kinase